MNMRKAVKSFSEYVRVAFGSNVIPTDNGKWLINVEFTNSDGEPDETQFDIPPHRFDYGKGECEELESLWKEFCKENGLHQNSIANLYFAEVSKNDEPTEEPICSFEKCQTCHCSDCYTGMIAREKGEEEYNKFLKVIAEAEVCSAEE